MALLNDNRHFSVVDSLYSELYGIQTVRVVSITFRTQEKT